METLFSVQNWFTLFMLILLQAVLGFDNLLYISLESKKVAPEHQAHVRRMGLIIAIILRIVLLFAILQAIELFSEPFFVLNLAGIIEFELNLHALIVLLGGGFILYTAIQEIFHKISISEHDGHQGRPRRSVTRAIFWIVTMNLVFSFDTILSALALTNIFWIMATAIIVTGVAMIFLIDHVALFLDRNRMYEILGLFILMLVGVLLVSDGGHLAGLVLFGNEVLPMAKSTFYFVLFIMVAVDLVQSRYQKKLMRRREKIEKLVHAQAAAPVKE
ncbi:MAG: tellurium resistance protein TerC [Alphaproteobacteria bacterium]|nr:tellurium resistance protein TerC [Alphaproteobacteria bacterium]